LDRGRSDSIHTSMLAPLLLLGAASGRTFRAEHLTGPLRVGELHKCIGGRPHKLTYSVSTVPDDSIIQLKNTTVQKVDCDLDETQLQVTH
jgi:hypothetical protein